ncbi:phosphatase PAP2 family protein [Pseudoduganella sp. UC29_71]|uniref:phosphatase PAP2 family protein n=1 Tax=Pseudoduganella sp. UC29_71 TaxID=3350174 RepID=UPI00366DA81B
MYRFAIRTILSSSAILPLFLGVLLPLLLFSALAEDVLERERIGFDLPLLYWLRATAHPILDHCMLFASTIGSAWVVLPVNVVVFVALRKRQPRALYWMLATGGAAALNAIAKLSFGRPRPDLWQLLPPETSFSFPSGHAMQTMAMVVATAILMAGRPGVVLWLIPGGFYVMLVGMSRIYLGAHYPSDVLAGWCAACMWCVGLALIMRRQLAQCASTWGLGRD